MEAGSLLRLIPLKPPVHITSFRHTVKLHASLNSKGDYSGPKPKREWISEWVKRNDDVVRSSPIYVGGLSLLAVLFNRAVSGIAPVADASRNGISAKRGFGESATPCNKVTRVLKISQSRADLLTLGLAVTNILTGLVWLSIRPKSISVVTPEGVHCQRISPRLPGYVTSELLWAWESLSTVTCCRSLVVVYDGICVLQIGVAALSSSSEGDAMSIDTAKLIQGSLYEGVITSSSQRYLANLSLYPGKSELPFMPSNTQAVILQPLGDKGIAILGGDTIRGFTISDQAWITLLGDKLDATLSKVKQDFSVELQQ